MRLRLFEILSNQRRRYVLRYLGEKGRESDLRTLSEQIAARENGIDPSRVNSKQRMRAYTALRQTHLPKMDDHGIVEFDTQSGAVRATDALSELEDYLESVSEQTINWGLYYLGAGSLGVVLSGACVLDVYPLTIVPDIVYLFMLSLVVFSIAIIHVTDTNSGLPI